MIVAVFGPTAVGKTEVAVELANLLRERGDRPVAVSADAYQLYEGLDELVAKPGPEQLERLEHRLVSVVAVQQPFSVAQFAELAHAEIDSLEREGRRPIVVGGTGLYLRAALTELDLKPPPDEGLREQIERELGELGLKALHAQLPTDVAGAVHHNDRKRIVRALELERMGERAWESSDQLWSSELRRPAALFGLAMDRATLDERIGQRVEAMLSAGAVGEVERAIELGASPTARKAIGFRELAAHLSGELDLARAREMIERSHRRYVKRQLTWMRKLAGVEVIDRTTLDAGQTAAEIARRLDRVPARSGAAPAGRT